MIYGSSKHSIEVRKIHLKIWKFRDELESVIQERLDKGGGHPSEVDVSDLEELYGSHITTTNSSGLKVHEQDTEELPQQGGEDGPKEDTEGKVLEIYRARPRLGKNKFDDGVVALMDIDMKTISCFSQKNYLCGQVIVIEFLVPNHFFVTAEVLGCRNYNMRSRIISQAGLNFRLHAKWTYNLPGERTMLRRFLNSIGLDASPTLVSETEVVEEQSDVLQREPNESA